jgi:hypothetical protein
MEDLKRVVVTSSRSNMIILVVISAHGSIDVDHQRLTIARRMHRTATEVELRARFLLAFISLHFLVNREKIGSSALKSV